MSKPPKKFTPDFKLQMVLEYIKAEKTLAQLASDNELHSRQILRWRDKLIEEAHHIFADKRMVKSDPDKEKLLHVIDQLELELEFLKKKLKRND